MTVKMFCTIFVCMALIVFNSGCKIGEIPGDNVGNGNGNEEQIISKWQLWSSGTTMLRGANVYQRRVYLELDGNEFMGDKIIGPPFQQEDFDRLATMGANYVNISHPGIFEEVPPFGLNDEILTNLKNLIQMIGKADMFAVISARTMPGRSEFSFFWGENETWFNSSYYNDTIWTEIAAQQAFVQMWQEVARQFKENPYVVGYDLMVEPNANDVWMDTWEPGDFYMLYGGSMYDWNELYPSVIDAIRRVDPETPILVGAMSYSAVQWLPYMTVTEYERIVYTFHQYEPHRYTHQEAGGTLSYPAFMVTDYGGEVEYVNKNWLNTLLGEVDDFIAANKETVTVACNELGIIRWVPGASVFMDDQLELLEGRGINYALWEWSTGFEPFAKEVTAFNFRFGPDPFNTIDLDSSLLIEVIKKYWFRNTLRPSNVTFK